MSDTRPLLTHHAPEHRFGSRFLRSTLELAVGSALLCAVLGVGAERWQLHQLWSIRHLSFGPLDTLLDLLYLGYTKLTLFSLVILPTAVLLGCGRRL